LLDDDKAEIHPSREPAYAPNPQSKLREIIIGTQVAGLRVHPKPYNHFDLPQRLMNRQHPRRKKLIDGRINRWRARS